MQINTLFVEILRGLETGGAKDSRVSGREFVEILRGLETPRLQSLPGGVCFRL